MLKYFIGDVQPWLAQLNQREHEVMTLIRSIETQLGDTLTPPYLAWQASRDALLSSLRDTPLTHVAAIKTALSGCDGLQIPAAGVNT